MNGVDAVSTEQITSTRCVEGFDVGYCSIDEGTCCGVVLVKVTNKPLLMTSLDIFRMTLTESRPVLTRQVRLTKLIDLRSWFV